MANTYTQIYYHLVFAVKSRSNLVSTKWKEELYKYISGIIKNKGQKLMIINGMPDHIHLLIGAKADCTLSDLVRDIKANSAKWINEKGFLSTKFEWQTGYGAFSVSHATLNILIDYIKNQETHHGSKTLREEYIEFLTSYEIDYKEEYLFTED